MFKEHLDGMLVTIPRNKIENLTVNVPVNHRQLKIMTLIEERPNITIREMAVSCNVTDKTIRRNLADLRSKHLVERVGSDKNGKWMILQKK